MAELEIRPAVIEDVPAIALVLSQAAVHKEAQGDFLWGSDPFTEGEVARKLETGNLYTVTEGDIVVGTVTLTETDERVWEDDGTDTESAIYIHSLATSDEVRGRGVGERVIDWVVGKAQQERREAVRLDCSYTNPRLCGYYAKRGFEEVRRRDISRKSTARDLRDPVYQVALMQRDVSSTQLA